MLTAEDMALMNALQRNAAVFLQRPLREGFGLTAAKAPWQRTVVIAGRCKRLMRQSKNGVNGHTVASVEQAPRRIMQRLNDASVPRELSAGTAGGGR